MSISDLIKTRKFFKLTDFVLFPFVFNAQKKTPTEAGAKLGEA